jgi:ATP-binding cassette subfamily B protein
MNINVKLTLAVFAFLPLMAVFSLYFNKKMRAAIKTNWERIGDINAQVEDSLSGIRVVKSFANEDMEKEKFSSENNRFLNSRKAIYKNEAVYYDGMNAFMQLITAAVVVFGGISIINTSLDLADLITFMMYIGTMTEPIQN